ncbi:hypothetical protein [Stratiformator vulcanicus]|uniref:Uncharacterized protein n=1 Tax=Stratiformator vulcanicus TaxID=2527980 RepID=A0A517QW44_9PLAN|nr:hypothetical protein [Stratiformator vulcanicus]QDT35790.1 hypothetical protein Pan189_01430 [Stratiformator vulcanicus]
MDESHVQGIESSESSEENATKASGGFARTIKLVLAVGVLGFAGGWTYANSGSTVEYYSALLSGESYGPTCSASYSSGGCCESSAMTASAESGCCPASSGGCCSEQTNEVIARAPIEAPRPVASVASEEVTL